MFRMRTALAIAAIAVVASAALGAGHDYDRDLRGSVKIDGSSTVYPITEAVAEEFAKVCPRVRVTVGISGTGGGMKRFTVGETDISDASRPIKEKERKIAAENGVEFIEIPVAYDGISIVVNKSNTWVDQLSVDDLRKIFLDGSPVTTWKDVRADWPDVPISIYAPGTDSGTFDYFKDVVAGKTGAIRSDMSVSEDDNVLVRGVAGDRGGIGFFGCAYYFVNKDKLRAIPIVNPETARAVAPTPETIENGRYAPFSRPLFIYVSSKSAERSEVQALVRFYFEYGPELAEEVGYVRLPEIICLRAMVNFNDRMTGTQFLTMDGEKIHGPLLKVYRKLPVSVALGQ